LKNFLIRLNALKVVVIVVDSMIISKGNWQYYQKNIVICDFINKTLEILTTRLITEEMRIKARQVKNLKKSRLKQQIRNALNAIDYISERL